MDLKDPRAREVLGVAKGDASVLFVKTRDDDEAEALAREIEVTAFLIDEGWLDNPVAGNVFVHLAGPNVGLRDRAFQEISAMEGVSDLVEYHEFSEVRRVAVAGRPVGDQSELHSVTLVARSVTPSETPVEMLLGRPLGPEDEARPVLVVHGSRGVEPGA